MPKVNFTPALRSEYSTLFDAAVADSQRQTDLETGINGLQAGRPRYQAVGNQLGIPWCVVGVLHAMETGLSFKRHLHNGDPLTSQTVHVPAGRPMTGAPPYSWEESAIDALRLRQLDKWTDWSVPGMLYQIEGYNGFGYRMHHPEVLSPYLWSFSNHYQSGKYVADGTWSPTAKSNQCGAAVLLRRMAEKGMIQFSREGLPVEQSPGALEPLVKFSATEKSEAAAKLQEALNRFPGVFVKVDGVPGPSTSDACRRVLGHFLSGDPRTH